MGFGFLAGNGIRIKLEAGNEYLSDRFSVRCLEAFKSTVKGADGP